MFGTENVSEQENQAPFAICQEHRERAGAHQQLALPGDTICLPPTSTARAWSPGATESGGVSLPSPREEPSKPGKGSSLLSQPWLLQAKPRPHLLHRFRDSLWDPSWPGALGHSGGQRGGEVS